MLQFDTLVILRNRLRAAVSKTGGWQVYEKPVLVQLGPTHSYVSRSRKAEPAFIHETQELGCNRESRGRTNHSVDSAAGAIRCQIFIVADPIHDF